MSKVLLLLLALLTSGFSARARTLTKDYVARCEQFP